MKEHVSQNFIYTIGLFIIWVLPFTFSAKAQTANNSLADSLRQEILNKKGAEKTMMQLELAENLIDTKNKEAQRMAQIALDAAKKSGNKTAQLKAYFLLGRIDQNISNVDSTRTLLDSALFLSNELEENYYKSEIFLRKGINQHTKGDDTQALQSFNAAIKSGYLAEHYKIVGAGYSMMGAIFSANGLYDKAIEYIIKSRYNYNKSNFKEGFAWSAYLLGRIYIELKLYEKAKENFEQALLIYTPLSEIDGNKNGIALCYEQIGLVHLAKGNIEIARDNLEKVKAIHTASASKYGLTNANYLLGKIEYAAKNNDLALQYLQKALKAKQEMGDLITQPGIYEYLGLCLVQMGNMDEGIRKLQIGLDIAISNNLKNAQLEICSKLSEIFLDLNNLKKTVEFQEKQIEIQKAMLFGGASIKMEQLQDIYEIDTKNSQIAELKKQNEIHSLQLQQQKLIQAFMVIGITLILLVAGIIFALYRKIKIKNKQLNEANATKDQFFTIIAHDLRGPTQTLTTFLEHVYSEFDDFKREELKEILESLHSSAENVSTLLENLLCWARSQTNKIEYHPENLKLNDNMRFAFESLKSQAEKKHIFVTFNTDSELLIKADSNMFQTIMRNLLSNAIKFTPRNGSIVIKSEPEKQNLAKISISDTGMGIDKDALSKIFDINKKHHSNGTENEKGSGLGLILVNNFVEKNKGTMTIESQKNKGTTVNFTLPLAPKAPKDDA